MSEYIVLGLVLAGAAFYLYRRLRAVVTGSGGCGCGECSCPSKGLGGKGPGCC